MNKPKVILGIDPGIADTGFGIIEKNSGGKTKCITYGSIKTKTGNKLIDRLGVLSVELEKIIKKYKPDIVSVEELFFCNNAKTALVVGQARGVVLLTARQHNLDVLEFTPLQVKQGISTYGKADKRQVQKMVKLLLNLKQVPQSDDAADALAVAMCALNYV